MKSFFKAFQLKKKNTIPVSTIVGKDVCSLKRPIHLTSFIFFFLSFFLVILWLQRRKKITEKCDCPSFRPFPPLSGFPLCSFAHTHPHTHILSNVLLLGTTRNCLKHMLTCLMGNLREEHLIFVTGGSASRIKGLCLKELFVLLCEEEVCASQRSRSLDIDGEPITSPAALSTQTRRGPRTNFTCHGDT